MSAIATPVLISSTVAPTVASLNAAKADPSPATLPRPTSGVFAVPVAVRARENDVASSI